MVTTATPSMEVLRIIRPREQGISEVQACSMLGGSHDIFIDVHLSPIKLINEAHDESRLSDVEDDCVDMAGRVSRSDGKAEHIPPVSRQVIIADHRRRVLELVNPHTHFPYIEARFSQSQKHVSFMIDGVCVGGRSHFSTFPISSISYFSKL